jgi:RES domain-containing protein
MRVALDIDGSDEAKVTSVGYLDIADKRHPIWDGTGAALVGGRWNSPESPPFTAR